MKKVVCSVGGCRESVPAHQRVCVDCYERKLKSLRDFQDYEQEVIG